MRAVIQRVTHASVTIDNKVVADINNGLLILLGIEAADDDSDVEWLAGKIAALRIFNDDRGIMNLSIIDAKGDAIVVSQFTLHAGTKKGNRPSYIKAAAASIAIPLYEKFKMQLADNIGKPVQSGIFAADMKVQLLNDGPVTIIIDSRNRE